MHHLQRNRKGAGFGVNGPRLAYLGNLYGVTAMDTNKPIPVWIAYGLGLGTISIGLGLIVSMVIHTI